MSVSVSRMCMSVSVSMSECVCVCLGPSKREHELKALLDHAAKMFHDQDVKHQV